MRPKSSTDGTFIW